MREDDGPGTILEPAAWLSDDRVGMRAPLLEDAAHAATWFIGEDLTDLGAVRRALRKRESIPWGRNPVITLVVTMLATGRIAGGVMATRSSSGTCALEVRVPASDPARADTLHRVLALVVPWLVDEVGVRSLVLDTPADDEAMLAAARDAGMVVAVRRRQHLLRPQGRVDQLQLERVNGEWGRYAG